LSSKEDRKADLDAITTFYDRFVKENCTDAEFRKAFYQLPLRIQDKFFNNLLLKRGWEYNNISDVKDVFNANISDEDNKPILLCKEYNIDAVCEILIKELGGTVEENQ
jgi:hypothetical protein